MSRLRINRFFILFILILSNSIGCVTVEERPILEGQTKVTIQQAWGRKPDIIKKGNLKYNADELWEYETAGGGHVFRYYFKSGVLIKKEFVTYAP